jgi:hypothetical protein
MLQTQKSLSDTFSLLETSNQFYQDLLGYKPEQTSLQSISNSEWFDFTQQKGLNPNSSGIYLPRNQTAIIQEGNSLSLFHEYFGHGLYCEQSLSGRKLVNLEKKLLEEEKQEFQGRKFKLNNLREFRKQNKTFQELEEFRKQNLAQYELFAIWTEYLLSKENRLINDFEKRYDFLDKENKDAVDSIINFSEQYGNLATFYASGLRKIQDKKRLLKLSKELFGKSLNRTPLVLHFGSGKPFSDIDLFVVSNDIPPIYDDWIDVRAYKLEEIEEGISVLNPMITDPIIVGNLINGDGKYLEKMKKRIFAQPITEKAIKFSLQEYEVEKKRSTDEFLGEHLQNKNLRSAKTFLTNALSLRNGDKVLTFNRLVDYSYVLSQSEKFIELKGGINK